MPITITAFQRSPDGGKGLARYRSSSWWCRLQPTFRHGMRRGSLPWKRYAISSRTNARTEKAH